MNSILDLSISELRQKIADGSVKPSTAVEACLEQISVTEPKLNACIKVMDVESRTLAAKLDKENSKDVQNQPLFGVPVTLKDVFCTKGVTTTCASKTLANFVPPYDATVVEKLVNAGAIIVAKTNMDEFAMGSSCESSYFGATANPHDTNKVPGGSSGGSAASVAAKQAFASLGTDSGGSIRQPAALCGCVGLKPTYGRVSRYGVVAYASSFDQVGPMARSVADAALVYSVIAGHDPKDATSAVLSVQSVANVGKAKSLEGKTFGLPKEMWQAEGISDEVAAACKKAVELAKSLGAKVVDVSIPSLPYAVATYYILTTAEASTNLARFDGLRFGLRAENTDGLVDMYTKSRSMGFGEEVKRRIILGTYVLSSGYYDAYFTKAAKVRRLIQNDFNAALSCCDAILAPSSPVTAWDKGSITDPLANYKMDILTLGLNLAGLPGLSIPVGLGETSNLPVGLQIIGKSFDEVGILEVGAVLERGVGGDA